MLGSVEVLDDDGRVSLGGPQQRKLLAVLLCEPGMTLTYERLLEVLGPTGEPPDNARRTAISYISRLRAALGEDWITTSDAGYSLDVSAASVDAQRFTALVGSARSLPPERALDALDEALALWRGPVFGDLHGEWWARQEHPGRSTLRQGRARRSSRTHPPPGSRISARRHHR